VLLLFGSAEHVVMTAAGWRRQLDEWRSMLSRTATAGIYGLIRCGVFLAVVGALDGTTAIGLPQLLTYVWVLEALFPINYCAWSWQVAQRIRGGDLVTLLALPTNSFATLLAYDLGRNLAQLAVRSTTVLCVAALLMPVTPFGPMALPRTWTGWVLAGLSLLLVPMASFGVRFLQECAAFVTSDYRSIGRVLYFPLAFLAGFMVPIDFFPPVLRGVAEWSPMFALVSAPVRVLQGVDVERTLVVQAGWTAILCLSGALLFRRLLTRTPVHGG
jgi:ABC-2 type transport system permease protein